MRNQRANRVVLERSENMIFDLLIAKDHAGTLFEDGWREKKRALIDEWYCAVLRERTYNEDKAGEMK